MDEELMNSDSPFSKIDPIHDNMLMQEETINTSFNNPTHKNDVDASHRIYTPCKDTSKQENDIYKGSLSITIPFMSISISFNPKIILFMKKCLRLIILFMNHMMISTILDLPQIF